MDFGLVQIELTLLSVATAGYFLAWVTYCRVLRTQEEQISRKAATVTLAAWIFQAGSFALRCYRAGHLPIYNAYEFSAAFAGGVVLAHLIFERFTRPRSLGIAALPVALALLFYAWTLSKTVEPLIPIFKSYWLKVHILTAFVAYSSFAVTFAASCLYLITHAEQSNNKDEPSSLTHLDRTGYQAATVGFCFLTMCIISGAIWAEYVWGNFWSWDPKEIWSLTTWFIFAAYLHARYHRGWRERRAAILAIAGFLLVIMTYLGVDLVNPGQHDFLLWKRG